VSAEREPIWVPGPDEVTAASVSRFARWLNQRGRAQLTGDCVPDEISAAPVIPRTRAGKKLEIPVKRILQGGDPRQVMDPGAVDNPDALRSFAAYQTRTPIP
jgi:hypothetical protein